MLDSLGEHWVPMSRSVWSAVHSTAFARPQDIRKQGNAPRYRSFGTPKLGADENRVPFDDGSALCFHKQDDRPGARAQIATTNYKIINESETFDPHRVPHQSFRGDFGNHR